MTSMVERVARALCAKQIRFARRWDTEITKLEAMLPAAVDANWQHNVSEARAAIAAMREPTSEMVQAGGLRSFEQEVRVLSNLNALAVWNAMIDAALADSAVTR